jgi:hypothetical protein
LNSTRYTVDIYDGCPEALDIRTFRHFTDYFVSNLAPVNKITEQIFIDTAGDL